jgi:hypothetical protein
VPSKIFYRERARYGALKRSRKPDDPELLASRAIMDEESLVDAFAKAVAKSPPLTPEVCQRILGLLKTGNLPDDRDSSPQSQLEAAALIARQRERASQ